MQDWFKDLLASGIESSLTFSNSILGSSLNGSDGKGVNGIFSQYLGNPATFKGGGSTAVWTTIKSLSDNIIVPIGGFILCIIVLYELIRMVIDGNNFRDFDSTIFIRWIFKTFIGILLISNVYDIATTIFVFGSNAVSQGLNKLFPSTATNGVIGASVVKSSTFHNALVAQSVGELLIEIVLSFILVIVCFVVLGAIIIVLANRIIEVFMYLGIAPIPMATMMGQGWNEIGKNWIKNLLALSFQGFFIVLALGVFKTLFNNSLTSLLTGSNCILTMATLLGFSIALIFTIFRTGQISKSIFNAH